MMFTVNIEVQFITYTQVENPVRDDISYIISNIKISLCQRIIDSKNKVIFQ